MTSVEFPPVRVVDLAFVAEIGVFDDEYLVVRVAKVINGGVADKSVLMRL